MGCGVSSVRSTIIQQDALPDIQQISVPLQGYLPASPEYQQAGLTPSSSHSNLQVEKKQNIGASVDELSDPVLREQRLHAIASFDFSSQETSAKRKLDKQSVTTDLENLSINELERINDFLNYLDREELMFKRPDTEVNDIKDAVGKAVDSFGKYISEKYQLLAVSHKHAVGSFAEGTTLFEPNEFNFILVLGEFNERNVSVERCMEDCTHIPDKPHAHIKIKNSEWWNAKATEPDKWQDNGLVCNWLNFVDTQSFTRAQGIWNADKQSFTRTQCEWNVEIETQSGTLYNAETGLHFSIQGPAFTFELLWKPKQGKSFTIFIDASLAIERRGVTDVIELEDVPCQEYIPDLLEEDMYFVLIGEGKHAFKYTVTTTEVKLMQKLSTSHRQCYRILEFLSSMENCYIVANCCMLKPSLLSHASSCTENSFLFKCLNDVLDKLEDTYNQRTDGVRTVFLSDVKRGYCTQAVLQRFVSFVQTELMNIGKSQNSDNAACYEKLRDAAYERYL